MNLQQQLDQFFICLEAASRQGDPPDIQGDQPGQQKGNAG
jgi:hypothetical protein